MELSVKELVVVHVCYRDVFNAPVSIFDLKNWIGIKSDSEEETLNKALSELEKEQLIVAKNNHVASYGKERLIDEQSKKSHFTSHLIKKHRPFLVLLGKIPFIRFIGISGSLAANNPTPDKGSDLNEGTVDMDLFMITSKNSLWLFVLFERFYTNLRQVFKRNRFYCFNYITEESFLEVYNRNFYTATEIINIKPVVNKGSYQEFLDKNNWFRTYYFNIHSKTSSKKRSTVKKFIPYFLWFPNFISFIFFFVFRCIKQLDINILSELKLTFDPVLIRNLKRVSNPKGGYQEMIKTKFEERLKQFHNYYSPRLMQFLFPKESLFESKESDPDQMQRALKFEKY